LRAVAERRCCRRWLPRKEVRGLSIDAIGRDGGAVDREKTTLPVSLECALISSSVALCCSWGREAEGRYEGEGGLPRCSTQCVALVRRAEPRVVSKVFISKPSVLT
jgi:hypothetical protein